MVFLFSVPEMPCFAADAVVYEWGDWSECTEACGPGTRERFRDCDEPKDNGHPCPENLHETEACEVKPCPSE